MSGVIWMAQPMGWCDGLPRKPGRYLISDGECVEIMRYHGSFEDGPEWSGPVEVDPKYWMRLPKAPDEAD